MVGYQHLSLPQPCAEGSAFDPKLMASCSLSRPQVRSLGGGSLWLPGSRRSSMRDSDRQTGETVRDRQTRATQRARLCSCQREGSGAQASPAPA